VREVLYAAAGDGRCHIFDVKSERHAGGTYIHKRTPAVNSRSKLLLFTLK